MIKTIIPVIIGMSLMVPLVSAGPIPKEFQDVAPEVRRVCLAESGTSVELIEKAGKGEFVDDQGLKSYLKCLFDQFRLLNQKGFNFKGFVALSPPNSKDIVVKMAEICKDTTGTDVYELSFNMHQCFYNAFPNDYFIM